MRPRLVRLAALVLLPCAAGCGATASDRPAVAPVEDDAAAAETAFEGAAHGFPALRDLEGKTLADGEFTQWLDGDRLHFRIRYDFGADHWIEERSVVRQEPTLVHERWSWTETRAGSLQRRFEADFLSGDATAQKREEDELRTWSAHVDVEPGRAFAGAAWALAIRSVRSRLVGGETIQFQTVGFTPKPRAATVEISWDGLENVPMSGRTLGGDRFRVHPRIPWYARPFVDVPDSVIWLASPPPAAFLRWEGPLAEPDDPLVRVDLLPGEPSLPSTPRAR